MNMIARYTQLGCRYHHDLFASKQWLRGIFDTMRRDTLNWNSIYITSSGTLENLKEATNAVEAPRDFALAAKCQLKDAEVQ